MEIKETVSFKACRCQVAAPNRRELGGRAAGKELQQQEGHEEKGEDGSTGEIVIMCLWCVFNYSMKIPQSLGIIKSHSLP